jgi:hypothetical protein
MGEATHQQTVLLLVIIAHPSALRLLLDSTAGFMGLWAQHHLQQTKVIHQLSLVHSRPL